ncbi:uncharacterized protein [Lolium perenne]|uniref:uncharacterized protein n=1 Tax=Lolium perenne TaxID=4522 RepID=UPI0021F5D172|nr:uncharacterized protein LOC127310011 [Lolium perenne]
MTPDEIKTLEEALQKREKAIADREAELDRLATTDGKTADAAGSPAKPTETTLPSPSTFVHSIKTYVPITLDLQSSNHAQWRELFLVALGRYGLTAHVTGDDTPSDTSPTSAWGRDDFTVLNWIYGSISPELFSIIMAPGSSARQIWLSIDNLFRDNKRSRALALDAEFRNTPQGDMSVHDYCAKLKSLADALGDVDQPISDETLVLTVLRGLNDQFRHLRSFLPFQVPFPSFLQTRSALTLEERQHKTDATNAAATALWASGNSTLHERPPAPGGAIFGGTPSGGASSGGGRGSGGFSDSRSFGDSRALGAPIGYANNQGGRGSFSAHRGRGRGGRGRGRSDPWMFNPWTGQPTRAQLHQQPATLPWQPRAPWRSPGVLGPRPGAAPQAYTALGTGQPQHGYAPPTPLSAYPGQPQPQVDPALLSALNNLHLPGNQEWFMDTGASSHMASDHGSSFQDRDPSMQ